DRPKPPATAVLGAGALLRDPGFLAIIIAAALIQGSHAAYYAFASITWQASGLDGLTIAGLWVLGVLAEIVVFALSPRFTLAPAARRDFPRNAVRHGGRAPATTDHRDGRSAPVAPAAWRGPSPAKLPPCSRP